MKKEEIIKRFCIFWRSSACPWHLGAMDRTPGPKLQLHLKDNPEGTRDAQDLKIPEYFVFVSDKLMSTAVQGFEVKAHKDMFARISDASGQDNNEYNDMTVSDVDGCTWRNVTLGGGRGDYDKTLTWDKDSDWKNILVLQNGGAFQPLQPELVNFILQKLINIPVEMFRNYSCVTRKSRFTKKN